MKTIGATGDMALAKRKRQQSERWNIFLFLAPAMSVYLLYNVYGIMRTFFYSTMRWTGLSPKMDFIGLDNFLRLFQDKNIWRALSHNLILVVVSIIVQLAFGLILALIVNQKIRGSKFLRTVYFMPMLLSTVATSLFWILMFDPYFGFVNNALDAVGLGAWKQSWLGNERIVFSSILFVVCWQYTPQYMILLRAGLTNIPGDVYEASTIDGASKYQQFWRITLPLLMPTMRTAAVLALVGSLKSFDLVYVMTLGGPNGATELLATYMYKKGFSESNMGYASAVSVFMFVVSLAMVIIFQFSTTRKEAEQE